MIRPGIWVWKRGLAGRSKYWTELKHIWLRYVDRRKNSNQNEEDDYTVVDSWLIIATCSGWTGWNSRRARIHRDVKPRTERALRISEPFLCVNYILAARDGLNWTSPCIFFNSCMQNEEKRKPGEREIYVLLCSLKLEDRKLRLL